jgi:hypothetical protein
VNDILKWKLLFVNGCNNRSPILSPTEFYEALTQSLQAKYLDRSSTGTIRNSSGVVVTVDPVSNIFKDKKFSLLRKVQNISAANWLPVQ